MKASVFFLGLTAGAITAAVTVLYSTPKSGNELRASFKNVSTDWKEYFSDLKVKMNRLNGVIDELSKKELDSTTIKEESFASKTKRNIEQELLDIQETLNKLEQSILSTTS